MGSLDPHTHPPPTKRQYFAPFCRPFIRTRIHTLNPSHSFDLLTPSITASPSLHPYSFLSLLSRLNVTRISYENSRSFIRFPFAPVYLTHVSVDRRKQTSFLIRKPPSNMQLPRPFYFLFAFIIAISTVVAQSNSTVSTTASNNGLIFSTITSGSITQTLVLKTTTITSCPCSTTVPSTPKTVAAGSTLPVIQGSSSANNVRPAITLAMAVVLGGAAFVLA